MPESADYQDGHVVLWNEAADFVGKDVLEMNENLNLEDVIIEKVSVDQLVKQFQPEIRDILYLAYGTKLEALPERINNEIGMESLLETLLKLNDPRMQRMILMRFGIETGSPMTLEEVAERFGVTRERVRQVESKFLRLGHRPLRRRKSLADFLNE